MKFPMEWNIRVGGALVLGTALVGGALYVQSRPTTASPQTASVITIASADVRSPQPTIDTDGDGYPDWEEVLRGTDPLTFTAPNEILTTPEDTEPYNPTTVTDKFSQQFLEDLIRASAGRTLSEEEKVQFVQTSTEKLVAETSDDLFTQADFTITRSNSPADYRAYGNLLAEKILNNSIQNENELLILQRAVKNEDPEVLVALEPIATAYKGMQSALMDIPVPSGLAKEHSDLVNTLVMIHTDIVAMRHSFEDPIGALVRIQRYQDDAEGLFYAFDNIRTKLEASGIAYASDESGIFLFSLRP